MSDRTSPLIAVAVLSLAACGGGSSTQARAPEEAPSASGSEATASSTPQRLTYVANPVLSVYVEGPSPQDDPAPGAAPRSFASEIVVINTGDGAADIAEARVLFDAWRGDERLECEQSSEGTPLEGPPTIEPGDAITYRAVALCDLQEPGQYEVRAYLHFGADAPGFHRERHYAGGYRVEVPAR